MATIGGVLTQVRAALLLDDTLAALSHPENPPGALNLPAWVAYAASGGITQATHDGYWDGVHTINVETHVARTNLAAAYAALMTYLPLVTFRLADAYEANRFGGTVILVGGGRQRGGTYPLRYEIAQDEWNGVETLALTVAIDVTIAED